MFLLNLVTIFCTAALAAQWLHGARAHLSGEIVVSSNENHSAEQARSGSAESEVAHALPEPEALRLPHASSHSHSYSSQSHSTKSELDTSASSETVALQHEPHHEDLVDDHKHEHDDEYQLQQQKESLRENRNQRQQSQGRSRNLNRYQNEQEYHSQLELQEEQREPSSASIENSSKAVITYDVPEAVHFPHYEEAIQSAEEQYKGRPQLRYSTRYILAPRVRHVPYHPNALHSSPFHRYTAVTRRYNSNGPLPQQRTFISGTRPVFMPRFVMSRPPLYRAPNYHQALRSLPPLTKYTPPIRTSSEYAQSYPLRSRVPAYIYQPSPAAEASVQMRAVVAAPAHLLRQHRGIPSQLAATAASTQHAQYLHQQQLVAQPVAGQDQQYAQKLAAYQARVQFQQQADAAATASTENSVGGYVKMQVVPQQQYIPAPQPQSPKFVLASHRHIFNPTPTAATAATTKYIPVLVAGSTTNPMVAAQYQNHHLLSTLRAHRIMASAQPDVVVGTKVTQADIPAQAMQQYQHYNNIAYAQAQTQQQQQQPQWSQMTGAVSISSDFSVTDDSASSATDAGPATKYSAIREVSPPKLGGGSS